ncbi:MAG: ubiquinol-cytochrome C chaperone family protein [Hyphomicrobiaceae bacterium]
MLRWLKTRNQSKAKASEIYGVVVAHARLPSFYGKSGVSDTMVGRYELIVLHMFLVMERLRRSSRTDEVLQRVLVERFVTDMDDCMREIGVGDLKVGRHVKRAAAGLYERIAVYRAALARQGTTPEAALEESFKVVGLLPNPGADFARGQMAAYVRVAASQLEAQSNDEILSAAIAFPTPPDLAS